MYSVYYSARVCEKYTSNFYTGKEWPLVLMQVMMCTTVACGVGSRDVICFPTGSQNYSSPPPTQTGGTGGGWGGFWTGAATGGALGYLFGNRGGRG